MPRPETVTVELRRDSIDDILTLLEAGPRGRQKPSYHRREAIEEKIKRQTEHPVGIGFCGLPASGKTTAAEMAGDLYDAQVVSMGDSIRAHAPERFRGEELANFAERTRDQTPEKIPNWTIEMIDDNEQLAVVEGVRSLVDYRRLIEYFSEFYLVKIETSFYNRLNRFQDRDREGKGKYTMWELEKRDNHKVKQLGYEELVTNSTFDGVIENNNDEESLRIAVRQVVGGLLETGP